MTIKPVVWLGDSCKVTRLFPREARKVAGFELWEVQQGKEPSDWKAMPSVGIGVSEMRVRAGGAYRVIYVAKFPEAIYVLHAFQKKTRKISRQDLGLARTRFRELIQERKR